MELSATQTDFTPKASATPFDDVRETSEGPLTLIEWDDEIPGACEIISSRKYMY
jgi:hypothetical protein